MTAGTRPTRHARRGFTLIELLVVIVILSIVAGMAAMAPADRGAQDLDLAAIQVNDAMERARALSRSQRMAHGVVFDLANDRFAVVAEDGTAATDPLTKRAYEVDFDRPNQPHVDITGASFGGAGAAALFDPQGVPLAGGTVTLTAGSHNRTLTLDPATGRLLGL
jgi:type II secretion system protein H